MTDVDSLTELMAKAIFANDLAWHGMLEKNRERFRNQARACLTALSEAGWVVVKGEPDDQMMEAAVRAANNIRDMWSAMVAAGRGEGT